MLDGRYGPKLEKHWNVLGDKLARAGFSPNAVTLAGLALVAAAAAAYLLHRSDLVFGVCLALAFAFDGLDGAVARASGRATRFGGYLDAVVDRYQEIVAFAAIAHVHDLWPAAFLAMSGTLLTSYNKARVALEIPVVNTAWPDLIERLERIVILVALLLAEGAWSGSGGILAPGLIVLGVLSHATAVQRFFRARGRLLRADREG
ncbi:MAG: CDP-alcohol phosphatidyltransferase family protein [Pseudomonadota bacterium]